MRKKRLYLIDGNALLYRAYYAIHHLTTSKGFPTNAIYGFISMLRKLIEQKNPHYLGIAFDVKGPTIRHKIFKDYKAHRKPMPEDLVVQIPVLKKIIKALNIPSFEQENYEADDVLGSLARAASSRNVLTVIVTTDKDMFQLVDNSTIVYNPAKELHLDEKKVKEYFGVMPSQVTDVLALWGDASDNIPGIPGIGEKTSKALINQFGSLENLLKNLDKVEKENHKEKIKQNLELLKLSQRLVTIEKNLDVKFNLEELSISQPNYDELASLFKELEFSALLSEYVEKSESTKKQYRIVLKERELHELINRIKKAKYVSLDTETDSLFPTQARLVGLSFSTKADYACYLPLGHDYPNAPRQIPKEKALHLLKEVLSDPGIKKIGQNIKYDYIVLKKEGIQLRGLDLDSMVLSYLLEPNWGKHNLNKLALTYLQVKAIPYNEIVGKGKNEVTINTVDIERVGPTRIYPPAIYEMTLKIEANQDFAGQVMEIVPADFEIIGTNDKREETIGGEKLIIWDVDWKEGETYELSYTFDAPDISPEFYLLGPLRLESKNKDLEFKEIRQWQIAGDAIVIGTLGANQDKNGTTS